MIKQDQTRLYDPTNQEPPGNCFQACVASLFELRLDKVPDETDHWTPGTPPEESWPPYWAAFQQWLRGRNLRYIELVGGLPNELEGMLLIVSGPSPRYGGAVLHACLYMFALSEAGAWDFQLVHDPHPDRSGLTGPRERWRFGVFVHEPVPPDTVPGSFSAAAAS